MTTHANYKDYYLRKQLKKKQEKLLIFKSFLLKEKNSKKIRFKIMLKMQKINQGIFLTKTKNRCIHSTRIRSVSRFTNLAKSSLRDNLRWTKVTGFRKSSW